MTSQWINQLITHSYNSNASTWKMICNLLEIDFIGGHIQGLPWKQGKIPTTASSFSNLSLGPYHLWLYGCVCVITCGPGQFAAWQTLIILNRIVVHISHTLTLYNAPPISHSCFSPDNSRKTSITRPLGRALGVFCEFEFSLKFYIWSCCAVCHIVLYFTAI